MRLLDRLQKSKEFWFLFINSVFFFFLRLPSLFEPYWYGDEGIYQVLGMAIRQGRLLYRDIFDNKPPLLYVLYSFFNGDQFWLRFINLVVGICTVIAFYYLSKKLFKNIKVVYLTTVIFTIFLGLPLIEGNIANSENFMLLPIIGAGILINTHAKIKYKNFIAGLFLGIAFLFKIVAVFDFAAFLLFLIFIYPNFSLKNIKNNLREVFLRIYSFIAGFIIPIGITVIYFLFSGAFGEFIRATFFSNIGYVGYGNKFLIPQGLLILKLLVLFGFAFLVFLRRKKLEFQGIFIFLWFAFSLYNTFFSQRPYTHYLLVLLPAFCLLFGYVLSRSFWKIFGLLILAVSFFLVQQNFWYFTKTTRYYQNFAYYITGNKSVSQYNAFFDRATLINAAIVSYIKTHSDAEDTIFVWGNNSEVYKLSDKLPPGKYAVAYHITSYKDGYSNTIESIKIKRPKLIIIMPNVKPFPFSLTGYDKKININNVLIYERIL